MAHEPVLFAQSRKNGIHHWNSDYVRAFWLPTLGPSATLIWHNLMRRFDHDSIITIDLADVGMEIGVKPAVAWRSFDRLISFRVVREVAVRLDDGSDRAPGYTVQVGVDRITTGQLKRLAPWLQEEHARIERAAVRKDR